MEESLGVAAHVGCFLSHDIVNKLAAIIGQCDILETEGATAECLSRLSKIRNLAQAASTILNTRSCEVQALKRLSELEQDSANEVHAKKPPVTLRESFADATALHAMSFDYRLPAGARR